MRLSGVRDGDIVQINDGLSYLALVRGRSGRRLLVTPLTGRWNPAPVKASEVTAHWRRAGGQQKAAMAVGEAQTPTTSSRRAGGV